MLIRNMKKIKPVFIPVKKYLTGFTLMEIVLATALFALFSVGVVGVVLFGLRTNQVAGEKIIAQSYASEGLEAVRSIKKQSFSNLVDTIPTTGLKVSSGNWIFDGINDTLNNGKAYTRTVSIATAYRDAGNNIVESGIPGASPDPNTKKITVAVNWTISGTLQNSILLNSYLSDWSTIIETCNDGKLNQDETEIDCGGPCSACSNPKSGMLVYSTGGTNSDSYVYRTINMTTNQWNDPINMPDIDSVSTNKALRMVKVYASPAASSRKEKTIISRHSNGTDQFIYAQVYNSATDQFIGTPILLSTINNNSSLFQQNFDGTYLQNGDFMAIFTDNSNTPKFKIWNGTSWTTDPIPMRNIGGIPNWIVARTRPETNEVMVAFFSQNKNTRTEYFNGGAYSTNNWTLHTRHSADATADYYHIVDFAWSPDNPTKGALVYAESASDRSITAKIWTADEHGGGSWSSAVNSANQASGRYLADLKIVGRPGTNQFITCDEDSVPTSKISCFNLDLTPAFSTPTNYLIANLSDNGPQRAFDIAYPSLSGAIGLGVYSDKTNIAKLKKFNAESNIWDSSTTTAGTLSGTLKTVTLKRDPLSNDIMVLLADNNKNLYTEVWNGETNQLYTTPVWKSFADQQAQGSANEEYWYDFAWDN